MLLGSAAAFLTTGLASADTLIGNYSAAVGTGTIFGTTSTTMYKAAGFTMPAQSYTLDRVRLSMSFAGLGTPVVSIWTGATVPTTQIATLNNPPTTGVGDFEFTPAATLTLTAGQTYWVYVASIPNPTGNFLWDGTTPSTLPTGIATFVNYIFNGTPSTFRNRFEVIATPAGGTPCYANCDASTVAPILNVNDFTCFLNTFAAGSTNANCDASTVAPILNVNDFTCFLNTFAAGSTNANCDASTVPPILNVNDFTCFINRYAAGCP